MGSLGRAIVVFTNRRLVGWLRREDSDSSINVNRFLAAQASKGLWVGNPNSQGSTP
jgi:hypothetical protein